jgi:hypothetical protein
MKFATLTPSYGLFQSDKTFENRYTFPARVRRRGAWKVNPTSSIRNYAAVLPF